MCKEAGIWRSGNKRQLAVGLLNWRDQCRYKGQKFFAAMRAAGTSQPHQLDAITLAAGFDGTKLALPDLVRDRLIDRFPEHAEALARQLGFAPECFTNREPRFLAGLKNETKCNGTSLPPRNESLPGAAAFPRTIK
jgi:hypothetical protein